MNNVFTLATGITNRIGENKFFLTLDYDNLTKENFHIVKKEIVGLIEKYNLSSATIYSTTSGFHIYFFYDNNFKKEDIIKILGSSKLVDENFKKTFIEFSQKGKGVTLRLNGKYNKRDIYFFDEIKGRKPTFIEKTIGESLSKAIETQLEEPIIDNDKYKYDVESISPGIENKKPVIEKEVKINDSIVKKQTTKEVVDEIEKEILKDNNVIKINDNSDVKKETKKKILSEELFKENTTITKERNLWYVGDKKNIIARLISASTDKREIAFIKNREIATALSIINNFVSFDENNNTFHFLDTYSDKIKTTKINNSILKERILELVEKYKDTKVDINNFIDRRPFFLNNDHYSKNMLKSYMYSVEKSGIIDTPIHFFKGVSTLNTTDLILSDKIKSSSMYNYKSLRDLGDYINQNKLELLDSFDLIYDFDTKDGESTLSYDNCKKMRDLLNSMSIPFSLNFSGSKGFHIRIPGRILKEVTPELFEYIKEDEKNIKNVFNGLIRLAEENNIEIDKGVYSGDIKSLIRVEWSIHQATGSVVKPLTDSEFDKLEGIKLSKIQEMYKPSNLLKGNVKMGVEKLNVQKKDIIVKVDLYGNGEYFSLEDINNSEELGEEEYLHVRNNFQNPLSKELKAIEKEDPKKFNEIIGKGFYKDCIVEAPGYVDLLTGRNYDFCRKGDNDKLKDFIFNLIK